MYYKLCNLYFRYQHILPGTYFEKRQKQLATVERYQGVDWAQLQTRQSVPTCVHVNESQVLLWWSGHHIATVHYTGTAKVHYHIATVHYHIATVHL